MLSRELIKLADRLEDADRVRSRRTDLHALAMQARVLAEGVANLEAATVPASAHLIPTEHRHLALVGPAPDPTSAEGNLQALLNSAQLAIDRRIEAGMNHGMSKLERMLRDHFTMTSAVLRKRS